MKTVSVLLIFAVIFGILCGCSHTSKAEEITKVQQNPKSISILSVGNSLSVDAMWFLYDMLKEAGYEQIKLGILYHSGCSMASHLSYAATQEKAYDYYYNNNGAWYKVPESTMDYGLSAENWDVVTFQEASKSVGKSYAYTASLTKLIDYVAARVPSDAKLYWHMTWAFQSDYVHSAFEGYDNDQMKMYNGTLEAVQNVVLQESRITGLIPCATTIQNLRTSFLGDRLTRDGRHLNYYYGRYAAALTWCAALTGIDANDIQYNPHSQAIPQDIVLAAKECVNNAIAKPFEISACTVPSATPLAVTEETYQRDTETAKTYGVDLSSYTLLTWTPQNNRLWSNTKATISTPKAGATTENKYVCCERLYPIEKVPAGSVFIVDSGWQYRLDIYRDGKTAYTGDRAERIYQQLFRLTDEFLDGCKYISWNVCSQPSAEITDRFEEAGGALRIYVPK